MKVQTQTSSVMCSSWFNEVLEIFPDIFTVSVVNRNFCIMLAVSVKVAWLGHLFELGPVDNPIHSRRMNKG